MYANTLFSRHMLPDLMGGKRRLSSLVVCLSCFIVVFGDATHFRGGTVWWTPSTNYSDANRVFHLEYLLGWRMSLNSDMTCTTETIANQSTTEGLGTWKYDEGEIGPADFICSEFDEEADWIIGYNRIMFNASLSNLETFLVWYDGRCWIDTLYYPGCAWNISLSANLGVRSDTNLPNHSPKTGHVPIKRLHAGCPSKIAIPTTDPDGDNVRCRFAKGIEECGDICQIFPFFSFEEEGCTISYNGGGSDSTVSVAIVIEDYPRVPFLLNESTDEQQMMTTDDVISYITLQFLVILYTSDDPCNAKPTFVRNTPPDGQVVSTVVGSPINIEVYAKPSAVADNITDVIFIYPFGAQKSAVRQLEDNVYGIDVDWTPTIEQTGTNIFCFNAKDTSGLSVQRCITVVVGNEDSACEIENGGCSDDCNTLGNSYYCDCPKECWGLSTDERTCKPDITTECQSSSINIIIPKCSVDSQNIYLAGMTEDTPNIPDECRVKDENGTYRFSYSFDQCQTTISEDFWDVTYMNTVTLWADGSDSSSLITRGAWYTIPIWCKFSKFGNLTASFQPENRNVDLLAVPGLGSFSFFIDFYKNSTFDQAVGPYDYPLQATINSDLYFGVRASGGSGGMQIHTVNCYALPTSTPTDTTPSYTIVEDGCIEDTTMVKYSSASPMEEFYSIKAFKFKDNLPDNVDTTVVFIQCQVVVCTSSATVTTCSKPLTCSSKRRRRRNLYSTEMSRKRQRRRRDETGASFQLNTSVTESPIHDVTSGGGIEITVINDPDVISESGGYEDTGGGGGDLSVNGLSIGIIAGCVAGVVLFAILGIYIYHNKIVRPRSAVRPYSERMDKNLVGNMMHHHPHHTYVQDIYLPNMSDFHTPRNMPSSSNRASHNRRSVAIGDGDDVLWARRVITMPPNRQSNC